MVKKMRSFSPALWCIGVVSALSGLYFHRAWSSSFNKYAVYVGLSAWGASTFYFLLPLESVENLPKHRRLRGFLLTVLFALYGLILCTESIIPSHYLNICRFFVLVGIMWCLIGVRANPKTS